MSLLQFETIDCFDAVYGASAGAMNSTYFLTRESPPFFSKRRRRQAASAAEPFPCCDCGPCPASPQIPPLTHTPPGPPY
jgi:hypothetical protein